MSNAWVYLFLILAILLAVYSVAVKLLRFLAKGYLAQYVNQLFDQLQRSADQSVDAAYQTENREEVQKALRELAYTKLEIFALPATTYQQQMLSIDYVIHAQLPPSKRLVELLIRALPAAKSPSSQRRYKLQAKIAGYLHDVLQKLQGEEPVSKPLNGNGTHKVANLAREREHQIKCWVQAISIWFTAIVVGAFLAFTQLLDLIPIGVLVVVFSVLWLGVAISLMLVLAGAWKIRLARGFVVGLGIVITYMALYSHVMHGGMEIRHITGPDYDLKVEYPRWLIEGSEQNDNTCQKIILTTHGNTPFPFDITFEQSPDSAAFNDAACALATTASPTVKISAGQQGRFVWFVLPPQNTIVSPEKIDLIPQYDSSLKPQFHPRLPPFSMRIENPIWKYARDVVVGYMGVATVIQAIFLWMLKSTSTS
jgi:hypothetical protein